ncbi:sulfatase-modifying factor 1 (C-alpha-formyglycine-generating enzyme 1) [Streptococcus pneumoniae]|nr:sulfatase-modifying factor 1 (C-alpha-formyglycine-generating enzyme 1) [Streptococcus pneumoniae]
MKMKKIKGGTFMMGTNSEEGFLDDFEGPQVAVSVKDFSIADTPVTNQEFAQFVKETGYKTLAERQECVRSRGRKGGISSSCWGSVVVTSSERLLETSLR